jgi:hypothetical protein
MISPLAFAMDAAVLLPPTCRMGKRGIQERLKSLHLRRGRVVAWMGYLTKRRNGDSKVKTPIQKRVKCLLCGDPAQSDANEQSSDAVEFSVQVQLSTFSGFGHLASVRSATYDGNKRQGQPSEVSREVLGRWVRQEWNRYETRASHGKAAILAVDRAQGFPQMEDVHPMHGLSIRQPCAPSLSAE